jgi:hypothetical protein
MPYPRTPRTKSEMHKKVAKHTPISPLALYFLPETINQMDHTRSIFFIFFHFISSFFVSPQKEGGGLGIAGGPPRPLDCRGLNRLHFNCIQLFNHCASRKPKVWCGIKPPRPFLWLFQLHFSFFPPFLCGWPSFQTFLLKQNTPPDLHSSKETQSENV